MRCRTISALLALFSVITLLGGCATGDFLGEREVAFFASSNEELERIGERETAGLAQVSSPKLMSLCTAYAKLKRYNKLFPCLDRLEDNIQRGDKRRFDYDEFAKRDPVLAGLSLMGAAITGAGREGFEQDISALPFLMRAEAYLDLARYPEAIEQAKLVKKAIANMPAMLLDHERRNMQIMSVSILGLAYALGGDRENAIKTATELENISTTHIISDGQQESNKSMGLAKIYLALKDYPKALGAMEDGKDSLLDSLFKEMTSGMWVWQKLPREFVFNKTRFEVGQVREAKEGYDKLLGIPQTKENGDIYWVILFDRGRIAEKEGDRQTAIEFYRKAVEVIEAQRASINTEASKIGFVGDKQTVYQGLIAVLFADSQYAVAFEYIERSKARALVDLLASKQDFAVAQGNAAEVRTLLARANTAEAAGRVQGGDPSIASQRSLAVQSRQQLHQQAPELSSLVSVTPVTVQEIQAKLPSDEVLVEYYAEGKELYAFVLSKGGLQGIKLNGEGLTADVQNFRQALQDTRSTHHRDLASKLYSRLVKPLEGAMKERNVLIVAHGPLHYLPFNALHDGNGYLIERYSVRQLPSASVLKYLKGVKAQTTGTLLAFGNPDLGDPRLDLKHAQTEAQDVAKVLPNSKALVRREASESAFKRYGEGFRYLHIASHGTFNADSPLSSALLLAKDSTNDGTLTVGELYSMRLDADLVTLSACETGLGKIANGDDVVGLTRGFLYAGSRSIVASLWKVDDEATAYLMTRFYGALKGTSKREALRLAQIETRKKYPHPYYWAAFQLTGEAN